MSRERKESRVLRPFRRLIRGPLRLRVLIAVVSVTLIALVGFDFAAVTALRGYLMSRTDTTLRAAALLTRPRLVELLPVPVVNQVRSVGQPVSEASTERDQSAMAAELGQVTGSVAAQTTPVFPSVVGQYNVVYVAEDGQQVTLENGAAPSPMMPGDLHSLMVNGQAQTVWSANGKTQLRVVATRTQDGILVISASLDDVNHTVDRMRLIVLIGSATAVLLIGLGVFWLLRRGLRPIETMAAQADRITAGDLTDRVSAQDLRSEVGRLGTALNGMLARIETSVHEREVGQELMRQFFADASHELRTPLASLRANAELYQQGALAEQDQVDEVMRRIALEAKRMSGLVDDMLRLARLDQHPDQQREPIALTELVAGCLERILVAAPDHAWHAELATGVVTVGDEELLRRAVDNLLANVLAHTPAGTEATVALRKHEDVVEIEVSDTGPGVPEERLPRIFDRFYRADTATPRPGSGLGLAIVTQIATVHNGTVVAEPNEPHGLRVRITLPVDLLAPLTHDSHNSPAAV